MGWRPAARRVAEPGPRRVWSLLMGPWKPAAGALRGRCALNTPTPVPCAPPRGRGQCRGLRRTRFRVCIPRTGARSCRASLLRPRLRRVAQDAGWAPSTALQRDATGVVIGAGMSGTADLAAAGVAVAAGHVRKCGPCAARPRRRASFQHGAAAPMQDGAGRNTQGLASGKPALARPRADTCIWHIICQGRRTARLAACPGRGHEVLRSP